MAGVASRKPVDHEILLREAATWFECVHDRDVSVESLIHFARWLDTDPANRAAYERAEKLCLDVARIGQWHWPTEDELSSDPELPDIVGKTLGD
jgi:ferric-dicitrate binding protein FerR (iron transport regulator)